MTKQLTLVLTIATVSGCELAVPRDVTGNVEVTYADNLRIFIDGELVAEVTSGEDASFEWDGQTFQIGQVCSDEGVECPGESYWRTVGIDQPWGPTRRLLNFVNLDPERGEPGQRMGGLLADDGSFEMLSGLDLDGAGNCAALGVGTVVGRFTDAGDVEEGIVRYEWSAGCRIGDQEISGELLLETDYTAVRTGDLDLSAVEPAPPITESGEPTE